MTTLKPFAASLLTLALGACSSAAYKEVSIETARANFKLATAAAEASKEPLVEIEMPMPDGQKFYLKVARPGGGENTQYLRAPEDPMMRVLDRGMGVLGTIGGIYFGGEAAKGLVEATSSGIASALKTIPDPVIVQPPAYNEPVVVQPPPYNEPVVVQPPPYNEPVVVQPPPYNEPIIVNPTVVNPEVVTQPKYNDPIIVQPVPYNDPVIVDPVVVQPTPYNDPIIVEQPTPIIIDQPEPVFIEPVYIPQ